MKKKLLPLFLVFCLLLIPLVQCDSLVEIFSCGTGVSLYVVRANYPSASGWLQEVSQAFIAEETANLSSIDFMLSRSGASPDFTINVELQGISSESDFINGIAYPNGTVYDTAIDFDESTIGTAYDAFRFYFDGDYIVTNQSKYCVIFYLTDGTVDGDGWNFVRGANVRTGNSAFYAGSAWTKNTIDVFVHVNGAVADFSFEGNATVNDVLVDQTFYSDSSDLQYGNLTMPTPEPPDYTPPAHLAEFAIVILICGIGGLLILIVLLRRR